MMFTGDHLESRRTRAVRWTAAAVFMVAVHIAFTAIALMHRPDDGDDVAAGPLVVELVQLPMASPPDPPNVAHGPLMNENPLAQQATKETQVKAEMETPPVAPSPLAPEPEVVVPVPKPVVETKPEEAQPQEETEQREGADQTDPMTSAPPPVDIKDAPVSPAASLGSAATVARSPAWEKTLTSHLNRHKRYPDAARARNVEGTATVTFVIDQGGNVLEAQVTESSGSPLLDEEALAVLRRASPLPAPPPAVAVSRIPLMLPLQFRIVK